VTRYFNCYPVLFWVHAFLFLLSLCFFLSTYTDSSCHTNNQFFALRDEICYPAGAASTPSSSADFNSFRYDYPVISRYTDTRCSIVNFTSAQSVVLTCLPDQNDVTSTKTTSQTVEGSSKRVFHGSSLSFPDLSCNFFFVSFIRLLFSFFQVQVRIVSVLFHQESFQPLRLVS
jgi:hypothetical protein